jgi:hypothetical protein
MDGRRGILEGISVASLFTNKRKCPYCGHRIRLGDCAIVATNYEGAGQGLRTEQQDVSSVQLPSGRKPLSLQNGWPVVCPPLKEKVVHGFLERSMYENSAPEDLPAFACSRCYYPLPPDIDKRDAYVIGVLGINGAGKTHFLATSLMQAARHQALRQLGCTEFTPDVNTAARFQQQYYQPLVQDRTLLPYTRENEYVRFEPLTFRVTFEGGSPSIIIFHDIAGETLSNVRERVKIAPFLRTADGIIFLADPLEMEAIRKRLPSDLVALSPYRSWNQADVLSACINYMDEPRIPIAIVLAKSDLVSLALRGTSEYKEFLFERNWDSQGSWGNDIAKISEEVQVLLHSLGEQEWLAQTRGLNVTFHAVSALGAPPENAHLDRFEPIRCIDPIATVLAQIPGVGTRAG